MYSYRAALLYQRDNMIDAAKEVISVHGNRTIQDWNVHELYFCVAALCRLATLLHGCTLRQLKRLCHDCWREQAVPLPIQTLEFGTDYLWHRNFPARIILNRVGES
jgi:hypothetical protein